MDGNKRGKSMAKKQPTTFTQEVFTKRREGVEHRGVILRERFYAVLGPVPGTEVTLRESEGRVEYFFEGHWRLTGASFPV